jgi:hypothetical protein
MDNDRVTQSCIVTLTYLSSCVCTVANVHQIAQLGRIDLLVLGGDQKRSDANKLKLWSRDFTELEVSIDKINGQVQSFGNELEFQVYFHQPIHKDGSHAFVDVGLGFHVQGTDRCHGFLCSEVMVHILYVLRSAEWIFRVSFVNVVGLSILVGYWVKRNSSGVDSLASVKIVNWISLFHNNGLMLLEVIGLSISWQKNLSASPFLDRHAVVLAWLSIVLAFVGRVGVC